MTRLKGWRTFVMAAIGAVIGGVALIEDPDDWRAWVILGLSAVMAGMRAMTTTPPGTGQ